MQAAKNVAAGWSEEVCVVCYVNSYNGKRVIYDDWVIKQTPDCADSIAFAYPG